MFVEIHQKKSADQMPVQDIKPRTPEEYELRVIIWNADHIPKDVDFGGLADAHVVCQSWASRLPVRCPAPPRPLQ